MAAMMIFGSGASSRRTPIFKVPPLIRVLENEQFVQKRESSLPRTIKKKPRARTTETRSEDESYEQTQPRPTRVTFVEQAEDADREREIDLRDHVRMSASDYPSGRPTKASQIRTVFRHSIVEVNEYAQEREKRRRERRAQTTHVSQSVDGRHSRMACPDDPKMEAELYSFMVGSRYTNAHVYDKVALDQNIILYKHDYKRRYNEHKLLRDSGDSELVQTIRAQTARQRRETVRTSRSPLPQLQTHSQSQPYRLYSPTQTADEDLNSDLAGISSDELEQLNSPRYKQSARVQSTNKWVPPIIDSQRLAASAKQKKTKKASVLPSVRGLSIRDAQSVNFFQRQLARQLFTYNSYDEQQKQQQKVQQSEALKRVSRLEEELFKRVKQQPLPGSVKSDTPAAPNKLTTTPAAEADHSGLTATSEQHPVSDRTVEEELLIASITNEETDDKLKAADDSDRHDAAVDEHQTEADANADADAEAEAEAGGELEAEPEAVEAPVDTTADAEEADKRATKTFTIEIPGLSTSDTN